MKPVPMRRADFVEKIKFAEHRRQQLMSELFDAQMGDESPKFLAQSAGEILSSARECFDYLGQDIIEGHVLPASPDHQARHSAGTLKSYFPFHESQLLDKRSTFAALKPICRPLYEQLLAFTKACATNVRLVDTSFLHGHFLQLKDMVNSKKHDKLTVVTAHAGGSIVGSGDGLQISMSKRDQVGWDPNAIRFGEGMVGKAATEYRFAFNDVEVAQFCMFASHASERVIQNFYDDHFS